MHGTRTHHAGQPAQGGRRDARRRAAPPAPGDDAAAVRPAGRGRQAARRRPAARPGQRAGARNIHELFEIARRNAPCVLFLDEVDAIGQKRSQLRNTPMRSADNQLLLELDDISGNNDGVFLLAATNHPWDVDSALRRPGRCDRTLLVLPPDAVAREGVFRYHLKDRPVAGIDLARLAGQTDGYSGADIAHICETAAERALMDSVRIGEPRMIGLGDLEAAIGEVKPSLGAWFDT